MESDDDTRLMLRTQAGDQAAFGMLFDRHQHSVVRFCQRFVKDRARAEELAQDVFIKLYRSASRYRPDARFKTFLFRVATNTCLNATRRHEEKNVSLDDERSSGPTLLETMAGSSTPQLTLEARQVEARVNLAMAAMSDRERAAFAMCRFEGLAYRDIAEAMESTESAVKSLIHRATVQLMKHLEAEEGVAA